MRRYTALSLVIALTVFGPVMLALQPVQFRTVAAMETVEACPTSTENQDFQIAGQTKRLDYLEPDVSVDDPPPFIMEAGRVCVEPGVTVSWEDNDVIAYDTTFMVYVEQGTLMIQVLEKGTANYYTPSDEGYLPHEMIPGVKVVLEPGDSAFLENVTARIGNLSETSPAFLFVSGIIPYTLTPSCPGSCWMPT